MALDVQKQKEKREKFSRRRRHDPDADIDYINERNMKFNQKLERSYGDYTRPTQTNQVNTIKMINIEGINSCTLVKGSLIKSS